MGGVSKNVRKGNYCFDDIDKYCFSDEKINCNSMRIRHKSNNIRKLMMGQSGSCGAGRMNEMNKSYRNYINNNVDYAINEGYGYCDDNDGEVNVINRNDSRGSSSRRYINNELEAIKREIITIEAEIKDLISRADECERNISELNSVISEEENTKKIVENLKYYENIIEQKNVKLMFLKNREQILRSKR